MTASNACAPASLSDVWQVSDGVLCDILKPAPPAGLEGELESRLSSGFSFVSLTMALDNDASPSSVYAKLARTRHQLSKSPSKYILVDDVDDIRTAKQSGRLAIGFHFQGTEAVGRDLANVGAYYQLGVRWMLLAYNYQNNVGVGCIEGEKNDLGLSEFGKDLIAEMNRVGMLVDCSHSGHRTTMEAMAASSQPCIFSHSNPRALNDHPRNIRDDQIKACAQTGGVLGVNGVGSFMGEPKAVKVDALIRQIDYISELVGPEYVALGLDYMTPLHCESLVESYNGDTSKVGLPALPWEFFNPADTPLLLSELLARGYSQDQVRGVMGENFLRVAAAVWR